MAEQLYTIPVNEAMDAECECPVCAMYHSLEEGALDFTLGPSYMEDDIRMVTDEIGFCDVHVAKMYERGNRLGLALMLKTHADRVIRETDSLSKGLKPGKGAGLFKKGDAQTNSLSAYIDKLEHSCFVCNRIDNIFARYIDTFFYLYEREESFRNKFKNSKGLCNTHLSLLLKEAPGKLSTKDVQAFTDICTGLYSANMKRVRDDLSWFIDKFDYRNADAEWGTGKDALQRMMLKQNSVYYSP